MFLWICSSDYCQYEEDAFVARYCPWCGCDLVAVCRLCDKPLYQSKQPHYDCALLVLDRIFGRGEKKSLQDDVLY